MQLAPVHLVSSAGYLNSLPHLVGLPSLALPVAFGHRLSAQPQKGSCVHCLHDNARPARQAHKLQGESCTIQQTVCSNVKLTSRLSPRMPRAPKSSHSSTALLHIQPDTPTLKKRGDLPCRGPLDRWRRRKGSMRPRGGIVWKLQALD